MISFHPNHSSQETNHQSLTENITFPNNKQTKKKIMPEQFSNIVRKLLIHIQNFSGFALRRECGKKKFLMDIFLFCFVNLLWFYTRVTRIRFFEYLLVCSVEEDEDAVLEDCRLSSIQLFVRFDVAFIELFAVAPLLFPIDVLDVLVTIALSQLLALLLFGLLAVLVFISFTLE